MQKDENQNEHRNGNLNLWEVAHSFRHWVCAELRNLSFHERLSLRGDYLFTIDQKPRFIVMIDEQSAYSIAFLNSEQQDYEIDDNCTYSISKSQILNVIAGSFRSHILTDSSTLLKLLQGTLKARIAFVTSKVTISGDLPAFLKMASLLKKRGVRGGIVFNKKEEMHVV